MKALGVTLILLPLFLIMMIGLIFDTADFLAGMGVLALILLPMLLGAALYCRAAS